MNSSGAESTDESPDTDEDECPPPPRYSSDGYTDLNVTGGHYGGVVTGGAQVYSGSHANWPRLYLSRRGIGGPPGASGSLTQAFRQRPSPGFNAGIQANATPLSVNIEYPRDYTLDAR